MWKCQRCGKPVYFAERRQSLGFDWHPWCLKCEECGKILQPGQHAEHKSTPYCHIPCYSALFGPKLFGHGSRVESHRNFGRRENSFVREQKSLERSLKEYNDYFKSEDAGRTEGERMGVSHREVNGRLVLAGVLRIFWGIDHSIRLREFDDTRPITTATAARRKERDRKAVSVMADVNGAGRPLLREGEDGGSGTSSGGNGGIVKFRQLSNRLQSRPLSLDVEAAVRNLELRSASDESKARRRPERVSEVPTPTTSPDDAKTTEDETVSRGTKIRSWKTMPPRVMGEKMVAVVNRDRRSQQPSSLSPDLLRRTYPAVKSIESEAGSVVEARLQERTSNIEDIPGEIVSGSTLDKLIEFGMREEGTRSDETNDVENTTPAAAAAEDDAHPAGRNASSSQEDLSKPAEEEGELFASLPPMHMPELEAEEEKEKEKSKGPRALRRQKKMYRNKLRRRSSINGHWYDRDTSVFTPPKGSSMTAFVTSVLPAQEVIKLMLEKYKVESEPSQFALYVVKETGERRLIGESEFPLLLRVRLGPREVIAKLFLLDKNKTQEINHEVAQYLNLSYTECRSFVNMFYEEEEREVERIQYKYKLMKQKIRERMFDLKVRF